MKQISAVSNLLSNAKHLDTFPISPTVSAQGNMDALHRHPEVQEGTSNQAVWLLWAVVLQLSQGQGHMAFQINVRSSLRWPAA